MPAEQADQIIGGEYKGQKHRDGGQGSGKNGTPDFFGTLSHGQVHILFAGCQTINIFQYYHAVVKQHAHGQRHTHKSKAVDRDIKGIEYIECCKNGYGNGQSNGNDQPEVL